MRDILDIPFGHRFLGYWGKGYGDQVPVYNYSDIKKLIESHLGIDNLGLSISTYKEGEPYLLFLPFDFDSRNLRESWKESISLYNYIRKSGYGSYLVFSGKKGFHVYIATKPNNYTKHQIRVVQNVFRNIFEFKTLDTQIFGDVRRLMRIPDTYNLNGDLCRIIGVNEGSELDLDTIFIDATLKKERKPRENNNHIHPYPCIEQLVREDPEPRHLVRFTYVILRLSQGWTYQDILSEIESFGWVDYDPEYTLKQIEHIDMREYVPPSCKTLKELGYCIFPDCEFNGNINEQLKDLGII